MVGIDTVGELVDSLPPVRGAHTPLPRTTVTMGDRIRALADLADATCPDYRRIALDLWALRVEATREADTLDARLVDKLCNLRIGDD